MTRLVLNGASRAARLLAEVDRHYLAWAEALPDPVREVALLRRTYTGEPGGEAFAGPASMNPGITQTPWLFWELTACLEDEAFIALATGGCQVVLASVLLDHLVDGQADSAECTTLLHRLLHEDGVARLRGCLGSSSDFWPVAERLIREHLYGLASERQMRQTSGGFDLDRFIRMVRAKFSPIVVTMGAFLTASGHPEGLASVEDSIKALAVASQLLDDLGDWQDDLAAGRMTYFLDAVGATAGEPSGRGLTAEGIRQRIRVSWLDVDHLNSAEAWLERARDCPGLTRCEHWSAYLDGYVELTREHVRRATAAHLVQVLGPLLAEGQGSPRDEDGSLDPTGEGVLRVQSGQPNDSHDHDQDQAPDSE